MKNITQTLASILTLGLVIGLAFTIGACGDDDNDDGDGFSGLAGDQLAQELTPEQQESFCQSADQLWGSKIDADAWFDLTCYSSVVPSNQDEQQCNDQVENCDTWIFPSFGPGCLEDFMCEGATVGHAETCFSESTDVINEWVDTYESQFSYTCSASDMDDDVALADEMWSPFDQDRYPESCMFCAE